MQKIIKDFSTTDLNDAYPNLIKCCTLPFFNFGGINKFSGKIRTVVTMEDTKLAQSLFKEQGDGAVIVIDTGGSNRSAMLGDINATLLFDNGWSGIIINGVVRDSDELAQIQIGIKALGVTPVRSSKTGVGAIDVPIAFGNLLFEPGHHIYCDNDGVLVSKEALD